MVYPNEYNISEERRVHEGGKGKVLTRQVTNSGTLRHERENKHFHLGGEKHFIYIIVGDMYEQTLDCPLFLLVRITCGEKERVVIH